MPAEPPPFAATAPKYSNNAPGESTAAVVGAPYAIQMSRPRAGEDPIEPIPEFADALDALIDLYTYQYETSNQEILTALQEAINIIEGEVGSESGAPPPDQVPPQEDVELIG